jgi:hypothetical protein
MNSSRRDLHTTRQPLHCYFLDGDRVPHAHSDRLFRR